MTMTLSRNPTDLVLFSLGRTLSSWLKILALMNASKSYHTISVLEHDHLFLITLHP